MEILKALRGLTPSGRREKQIEAAAQQVCELLADENVDISTDQLFDLLQKEIVQGGIDENDLLTCRLAKKRQALKNEEVHYVNIYKERIQTLSLT